MNYVVLIRAESFMYCHLEPSEASVRDLTLSSYRRVRFLLPPVVEMTPKVYFSLFLSVTKRRLEENEYMDCSTDVLDI